MHRSVAQSAALRFLNECTNSSSISLDSSECARTSHFLQQQKLIGLPLPMLLGKCRNDHTINRPLSCLFPTSAAVTAILGPCPVCFLAYVPSAERCCYIHAEGRRPTTAPELFMCSANIPSANIVMGAPDGNADREKVSSGPETDSVFNAAI